MQRGLFGGSYAGTQHLELDADETGPSGANFPGEKGSMGISQTVSVVAGQSYRLTFAYKARPNGSTADNKLRVRVAGLDAAIDEVISSNATTWSTANYTLRPAASTVTIMFDDAGSDNTVGMLLDDVQLFYYDDQYENAGPVAVDDIFTYSDTPLDILPVDLLANDSDPDLDPIELVSLLTQPSNGQLWSNGVGGWTYQPNSGFEGVDSFDYQITDGTSYASASVLVYVAATNPKGWLFAATPDTPGMAPQWIPPEQAEASGVYIRRNGDDDNRNGIRDNDEMDRNIIGENDLLNVQVRLDRWLSQLRADGFDVILRRSSAAIQLWTTATKGDPLFVGGNEYLYPVNIQNHYFHNAYVEWTALDDTESATLELLFTKGGFSEVIHSLTFKPFNSIVIGYVGEFQTAGDMRNGMTQIIHSLYRSGYDAYIYDEDDMAFDRDFISERVPIDFDLLSPLSDPPGASIAEVENAILNRGVKNVSSIGYSHGGGAVYLLADALSKSPRLDPGSYDLGFTAYIDAVRKMSMDALADLPPGTAKHYNVYQTTALAELGFRWIQGTSVPGSIVDDDVDAAGGPFFYVPELTHTTKTQLVWIGGQLVKRQVLGIAEVPAIQSHLVASFKENFQQK